MNKYPKIMLLIIASIVTIACMVCLLRAFHQPSSTVAASDMSAAIDTLPSIKQIQQMINDRGYKIKIDGMVCGACYNPEHSETQKNWDLAYNDQCARQEMK